MSRVALTDEQITASASRKCRLFIEATPGSGKTTVAAERYGVLRFNLNRNSRGSITAVSFTRSATYELYRRIRRRWGLKALEWPHHVSTIDRLICDILHYLLRCEAILWFGGRKTIEVLDDWRGHRGYRWLEAGNRQRVVTLSDNACLTSKDRRVVTARFGFSRKSDFHRQLEAGRCTHEDMRCLLAAALQKRRLKSKIKEYLVLAIRHLIVDEIFDANQLDLALIELCCAEDIDLTIIGDPWQALYGFRGATPDLVPELVSRWGFIHLPLSQSFRFKNDEMKMLSIRLRDSQPVEIHSNGLHEIALASKWETLWSGLDHILPLSFGRITNQTDAAMTLLLDYLVRIKFSERAIFLPEAMILLNLDAEVYKDEAPIQMAGVVETLTSEVHNAPEQALNYLRDAIKSLGAFRRPRRGSVDAEQRQIGRLELLRQRLSTQQRLVPGMTIHQAKGQEWDHVGVLLNSAELSKLASGLNKADESDRALYVALTRARKSVTLL